MYNDLYGNSNVGSKRAKHTPYARQTSLFRKLENEIEREKLNEKAKEKKGKTVETD